ncbi:MAG TPA: methyl-accepting chemotaxis protein [Spirochaetota bacterium]|nr:methyl-accepting chemotaxis protein [Spirochaetota bacterium]
MSRFERPIESIPFFLFRWFLILFILDPLFFGIMMLITIGSGEFMVIAEILGILAPPILIAIAIYLFLLSRKLRSIILALQKGDMSVSREESSRFASAYPFKMALFMFIGNSGGPMLVGVLGMIMGVLISFQQALFFIMAGQFEALVVGMMLYYISKTELYPLRAYIDYRPLSIFMKLSVPIVSMLMILLIATGIGVYRIAADNVLSLSKSTLKLMQEKTTRGVEGIVENLTGELQVLADTGRYAAVNPEQLQPLMETLFDKRKEMTEAYFSARPDGHSVTNAGKAVNIADREYFKELMQKGDRIFTEPLKSRATGKDVIVGAVPVMHGDRRIGVFGVTIPLDSIRDYIVKAGKENGVEYLLLSRKGVVMASPDASLLNKTIGKDIADDSSRFSGTGMLLSPKDEACKVTFNGVKKIALTARFPVMNGTIVVFADPSSYYAEFNMIMFQVVGLLLLLFSITMGTLFVITRRFSRPVQKTIEVLDRVAEGDFTRNYEGRINDEMGLLMDALNKSIENVRSMIATVSVSSQSLTQVVEQIARGNQNMSQRTAEQASSLEEVASTIEEATSIINQNADYAVRARDLTDQGAEKSEQGNAVARDAIGAINEMNRASIRIADITAMINEIAFQTNLLALNAAVEAARAGEQGRGFAVVAGEVRNLAQRSGNAAKEIEGLIKETVRIVEKGTDLVIRTGEALADISGTARESARIMSEITEASAEQRKGMEQINTAVSDLDQMTQQNASMVEETASASEEMMRQAQDLLSLVQKFRI